MAQTRWSRGAGAAGGCPRLGGGRSSRGYEVSMAKERDSAAPAASRERARPPFYIPARLNINLGNYSPEGCGYPTGRAGMASPRAFNSQPSSRDEEHGWLRPDSGSAGGALQGGARELRGAGWHRYFQAHPPGELGRADPPRQHFWAVGWVKWEVRVERWKSHIHGTARQRGGHRAAGWGAWAARTRGGALISFSCHLQCGKHVYSLVKILKVESRIVGDKEHRVKITAGRALVLS